MLGGGGHPLQPLASPPALPRKRACAALTRDEIAEDFAAIRDNRPPRRPPIRISILPRTRKCIYNHVSMPLLLVGSTNSMLGWRLGKSCWLEIREILLSLRIMALLWLLIRCLWKCQACLSWLQYTACVLQMPQLLHINSIPIKSKLFRFNYQALNVYLWWLVKFCCVLVTQLSY